MQIIDHESESVCDELTKNMRDEIAKIMDEMKELIQLAKSKKHNHLLKIVKDKGALLDKILNEVDIIFNKNARIYIKIGCTGDTKTRYSNLLVGCPNESQIIHWFYGDFNDEAILHSTFKELNTRGEWFRYKIDNDLDRYIEEDKAFMRRRNYNRDHSNFIELVETDPTMRVKHA